MILAPHDTLMHAFALIKALLRSLLVVLSVLSARAAITGQWDFDTGDLSATVGTALAYRGDTAASTVFTTDTIGGQSANIMRFPAATSAQGYTMTHGMAPNGGGLYVNQWTFIMDIKFTSDTAGNYHALLQSNQGNANDADLWVNGAWGIGFGGVYHGNLAPDAWHRISFVVDASSATAANNSVRKFIDGTLVGVNTGIARDGTYGLDPTALLFTDNDGETTVGYVNSIQFHDRALASSEIAALGGPNAAGIPTSSAGGIAQWDFNGTLASSTGGANLTADAAAPASAAGVSFANATIGGQTAHVASFTRGTFFQMTHGLPANGGGGYVNQYTLILDLMFPARPTGWAVLWQTSPGNSDDGDWFINSTGGLGISGTYGGSVADGTWNRVALVVDDVAGTFTSYLNGTQVQQISGLTLDGRWSLAATALLFADQDQENAAGYVNSVQLRARAMAPAEIAALGGAQAAGIPLPQEPSGFQLVSPNGGEVFTAGTTQTVAWVVSDPSGLMQIDLLIGNTVYRSLAQVLMLQSNYLWSIDSKLGDTNNYRIRISSLDFPTLQDSSDAAFTVTGSGGPPNLLFGQPLQVNGGFESYLTNWQVIAGHPAAFTSSDGEGAPYAGSRFLHGGLSPGGDMIVRQDIDLLASGFTENDLDTGAAVDAEAWLRNAYATWTFDDQAYFRVACLDALNQESASVRSMVAANSAWIQRTLSGVLPPGTRKLRLEIVGNHRRDADNDSMADAVVVRVQRVSALVSPQITKLPMLQDYRQDAMTLLWETDGNLASHTVEWGRSNITENTWSQIETVQIDSTHFVHRATLTGLSPETSYVYRVRSGGTLSATYTFRTAPFRNTPFAVAWWGDSQVGPTVLRQLIPSMLARGVDWMGVAGDLVSSGGSLYDWQTYWFGALEYRNLAQTHPALFARGNHDGEHPYSYAYSVLPGNGSWFAFDYGNSRFIFLDTEASTSASPEQYAWLVNELARPGTQNATFRVVCFHKLPYANLWNGGGYTGESWVRNDWVPLFRQYHVDAVINGHSHNYNRGVTNGVTYLVVGGGGGALDTERVAYWPLFPLEYEFSLYHYGLMQISGHVLTWSAFDNSDQLLDNFTLQSRVPLLEWTSSHATGAVLPLAVMGKPGDTYVLERSTDLLAWSAVATNTIPTSGAPSVSNSIPTATAPGFFRAWAKP